MYEITQTDDSNVWSEKIWINGVNNHQFSKGGPSKRFNTIPAWSEPINEKVQIESKKLSAIYLFIEGVIND
jgi:hypothetical protein